MHAYTLRGRKMCAVSHLLQNLTRKCFLGKLSANVNTDGWFLCCLDKIFKKNVNKTRIQ